MSNSLASLIAFSAVDQSFLYSKEPASVHTPGSLNRTLVSSSSSSLSSNEGNATAKKDLSGDTVMMGASSISPRDKPHQPVSTNSNTDTDTDTNTDTNTTITTITTFASVIGDDDDSLFSRTQLNQHRPFSTLPSELIIYIFKSLTSAHDLRSAILVCKLWCSCGMDLLWSRPSLTNNSVAERMVKSMALPNAVFPYADFIRRLNLSFLAPDLTDSILNQFASCSRLERLLLAGSVQATDVGLKKILTNCTGLYSLDLSDIPAVTDGLIEHVAAHCPQLHTLYLGACSAITDESIERLATSCSRLKRIKLSQCTLLTGRSVVTLTQRCRNLIEIDLTDCNLVTDDAIQAVFENLPQIRDLNMALLKEITNSAFEAIHPSTHRFEQLRVLNLTSCALITDETLARIIPSAPRLRNLILTKCDKITDEGVSVIKTLGKHLHHLHLGHCAWITDKAIATLVQHCTRIRYLDLACCSNLTDASVFAIAQLPKLRRIGLVKCSNITDHGIYAILISQVLPQTLERVHLSYCVNLSDTAIAALVSHCLKLTHLSLTGVPAFITPKYQTFCRAPPPEFTPHQREVFCVFSGKGVRELRNFMQETHLAMATTSAVPYPLDVASIRSGYRMMASTVASLVAAAETREGGAVGLGDEPPSSSLSPSSLPALTAATLLAQMGTNMISTSAGVISLTNVLPTPAIHIQGQDQVHNQDQTISPAIADIPEHHHQPQNSQDLQGPEQHSENSMEDVVMDESLVPALMIDGDWIVLHGTNDCTSSSHLPPQRILFPSTRSISMDVQQIRGRRALKNMTTTPVRR
ncbi:SCF ubiquitin ligase complex subunit [Mortierella polycephala]|uniref:SCF ubiquitin ligase complex subunit n=1 Tax=Mortierella polycephala TaxID=41804 RepID=A0A9P6TWJ4_9FUNG|nr:SCF ubiquitin ligase complex subunit [Mortierella polycephala]